MLSNCIFDVLKNNEISFANQVSAVVICFQIVSLTYWKTTKIKVMKSLKGLWFAFKLYLWRIEKQQRADIPLVAQRCDLLSNCIFDVLKNNSLLLEIILFLVVICFQIVSLTYWKTTWPISYSLRKLLWFAFKLYLWRIEKQLIELG